MDRGKTLRNEGNHPARYSNYRSAGTRPPGSESNLTKQPSTRQAPARQGIHVFNNLIESNSHRREFKRRGSFFLITAGAYMLLFMFVGVLSIYAYNAELENRSTELTLLSWVPPLTTASTPRIHESRPARKAAPSSPVKDPSLTAPVRTRLVASTDTPNKVPENVGTTPTEALPAPKGAVLGKTNADPIGPPGTSGGCSTCSGNETHAPVRVKETTLPPNPPLPKTQTVTSTVLLSKVISLPQPSYPPIAKQASVQGPVVVQILVDETGKVVSVHALSGHPFLIHNAEEAAHRARFTPTVLNGQLLKVQGVITYNFVLR